MSLGVDHADCGEGGFQKRRRGAVWKGWAEAPGSDGAEDPALPKVKVNPRTGGTCGGFAQPKSTGRSWERRKATAAEGALSSALGVRDSGRREAARRPSRRGKSGGGSELRLNPPTCGSPTPAPTSAPPRPRPGLRPAPPRARSASRPVRLAPPRGRFWRGSSAGLKRTAGWAQRWRRSGSRGSLGHRSQCCASKPGSSPENEGAADRLTDALGHAATVSRPLPW